ncbi:MAG: CRISPR-associated endonuclease Cas2 [Eubacteriales bacterium]|nr:CRISPR-associated endonuclease Cas2 [Clostridiales bacterium]MDY4886807.1 CRISPR-associated endonuclease Cas2 [Eubacteriales bacterium]
MSYRFMRMIVFFDLPTESEADRREYRKFRRMLVKNGFIMMQESVYCRMVLNATVQKSVTDVIRREKPPEGIVQLLTVTEKQFAGMTYITGSYKTDVLDSDERVVIL